MSDAPERPTGEVFLDARGNGRAMRLTWHHEADVVVLSLWRGDMCAASFRLGVCDVNAFVDALVDGLRDAPGVHARRPVRAETVPPQRQPPWPSPATLSDTEQLAVGPRHREPAREPESFIDWAFGDHRRADAS